MEQHKKHLEHLSSYYKFKQPSLLYDQQIQKRDDLEKQLNQKLTSKLEQQQHQISILKQRFNPKHLESSIIRNQQQNGQLKSRLTQKINNDLSQYKNALKSKIEQLNQLSPTNTMLRGYAIVNKEDNVVTSTKDMSENDEIVLTMKDGQIDAIVKKVRCNDE